MANTLSATVDAPPPQVAAPSHGQLTTLTLAAIGIVYGDIGTSPLYALKECLSPHYGLAPQRTNVLGLLSLMAWSLTMVVTFKYLGFITRATNRGEGGILALLALCSPRLRVAPPGRITPVAVMVVFGAALLYGDGMITPAISVLSAVEGLEQATHTLENWVVPLTCVILLGLFALQSVGTSRVGALFGPIMTVWFVVQAGLGTYHIAQNPRVLEALSPHHAVWFLATHGFTGFAVLGSVVLCVTGGEALYADMGHFGLRPIRTAWLSLVMPSLLISYFGQGANVLNHPEAAASPFFAMVPPGWPMILLTALATVATVIASQALISGAFSLTHQAVHMGLFPRVSVQHTSAITEGQIYLREINWMLAAACIALVLHFRSSTGLAAAYGMAVCGTMAITSIMFGIVARERWQWPLRRVLAIVALFLVFDLGFLASNMLKFLHGGYVPILVALAISAVMIVWYVGRSNVGAYYASRSQSWEAFTRFLDEGGVLRPPTVGVFMASAARGVPAMVLHQAQRIGAVPRTSLLVTVRFERVPWVGPEQRIVDIEDLGHGFHRVVARYGFMQQPGVPPVVAAAAEQIGLALGDQRVTYYLGRESFLAAPGGKMGRLSEGLFRLLARNALPASAYFCLPPEQVVEIGLQIDL